MEQEISVGSKVRVVDGFFNMVLKNDELSHELGLVCQDNENRVYVVLATDKEFPTEHVAYLKTQPKKNDTLLKRETDGALVFTRKRFCRVIEQGKRYIEHNGKRYRKIGKNEVIRRGALHSYSSQGMHAIKDGTIGQTPSDFSSNRVFYNLVVTDKEYWEMKVELVNRVVIDNGYLESSTRFWENQPTFVLSAICKIAGVENELPEIRT